MSSQLEAEGRRNASKKKEFFKLKNAGKLEKHILHMYDDAPNHEDGERKRRTDIINNLFEKKGNRGWKYTPDKPLFVEEKNRFHKEFLEAFVQCL